MTQPSRLWRAAEWLGLVEDRSQPRPSLKSWIFGAIVIGVCVAVIALLT